MSQSEIFSRSTADVHGKNHHRAGCFGNHVRALRMRVADGRILECSREVEPDLFRATVGGMGLTGHILEVEFPLIRVPSPWIVMESERIEDIDQFIAGLKAAGPAWPYTLGWIDCLSQGKAMGRGIYAFFSDELRKPELRVVVLAVTPAPIGVPTRRFKRRSALEVTTFCRRHTQRGG